MLTEYQIKTRLNKLKSKSPNMAELSLLVYDYRISHPDATLETIAKYFGLYPLASGISQVSRSESFLKRADQDIFDAVLTNTMSFHKASKEIRRRARAAAGKSLFL